MPHVRIAALIHEFSAKGSGETQLLVPNCSSDCGNLACSFSGVLVWGAVLETGGQQPVLMDGELSTSLYVADTPEQLAASSLGELGRLSLPLGRITQPVAEAELGTHAVGRVAADLEAGHCLVQLAHERNKVV